MRNHIYIISIITSAVGAGLLFNGLQLQKQPHAETYKTIGGAILLIGFIGIIGEGFIKKKV